MSSLAPSTQSSRAEGDRTPWWAWPLLMVAPLASATWFVTRWPGATYSEPWQPQTPELHWWRAAGDAVLAGANPFAEKVHFEGTPFGALVGAGWTWLSPWSMQWVFCALVALVTLLVLHRAGLRGWTLTVAAAAVLSLPPFHQALGHGSPFPLLLGLALLDLVRSPDRGPSARGDRWPVGIALGIAIALEPLLAGLWIMLLVAGRFRALATSLVTVFAAVVVARWWLPAGSTGRWLRMLTERRLGFSDQIAQPFDESVTAALVRLAGGTEQALATALPMAAGVAVVAAVAGGLLLRRRQTWTAVGITGLAGLAVHPIGLTPVFVFVLPLAVGVLRRGTAPALRAAALALALWITAVPWTTVQGRPTYEGQELVVLVASGLGVMAVVGVALLAGLWGLWRPRPLELPPPVGEARAWLTRLAVLAAVTVVAWFVAAVFLEPFHTGWIAWRPGMPDFAVYVKAAHAFLSGGNIYAAGPEEWPFLYPPVAAALAAPLGVVELGTAQSWWQAITAVALLALGHRLRLNGWVNGFATCLAVIAMAPIRHNVGLGQVSIVLMVLALLDVVEGPRFVADRVRGGRPLLPVGVLVGIGAAIKLTPAVFIPYLFLTGRRRAASWATGTFAGLTAVGCAIAPGRSLHYWTTIASGSLQFFPDTRGWLHNQSLQSAVQRFLGVGVDASRIGLVLGLVVAGLALLAGVRWARMGHPLLGASLAGVATIAAVPVAWHHYYVWVFPMAFALVGPRVPSALRGAGLLWVGWCSIAPFWALGTDDRRRIEFAYTDDAKLSAGAAAFGMIAVVVVALACARPVWDRLGSWLGTSVGALWAAAAGRTPVSATDTPAPEPQARPAHSS
ncbi:glycosyltransferase family 87 protein [Mariniluteicoccus flavus]